MRACGGSRLHRGLLAATVAAASPGGLLRAQEPGAGSCCRELHSLYEASIFQIDAMRLRVQVDQATGNDVAALILGRARSPGLESEVSRRYQSAGEAIIEMEFLVGLSGETFVSHTAKAIRELGRDGTLAEPDAAAAVAEATERFSFLQATKVRVGDVLRYEVRSDTLTTRYQRGDAVVAVRREVGPQVRNVILATFFAPSSNFRKGLLDDVFRSR